MSERYENEEDVDDGGDGEDYGNRQVQDDAFGYGASEVASHAFTSDNFNYAKWRASSPYLIDIQRAILTAPVTELYKNAMIATVYRLFTPTQQLANNSLRKTGRFGRQDTLHKKMIFAERDLLLSRCYATREDLIAHNAQLLENNILDVYEAMLTRTLGERREGIINSEITSRSITQMDQPEAFDTEPKKKKNSSFFSFFGGK